ncbi:MAG: hypothetical protein M3P99_00655 [Pseudomonadota bacterium]|nr:hypothetical protein [Pseudomonadota bacterium]
MQENDPLIKYGAPLAGVLIALVLSVLVAAMVAAQIGDDYQTRVWVYAGFVLWVVIGAAVIFMLAHRSEAAPLSVSRVLLWTASIWLWPVFWVLNYNRKASPP